MFVIDFLLIHSLLMVTINKTTDHYLISISSYSRLYSGIVDFLKSFFILNAKDNTLHYNTE